MEQNSTEGARIIKCQLLLLSLHSIKHSKARLNLLTVDGFVAWVSE